MMDDAGSPQVFDPLYDPVRAAELQAAFDNWTPRRSRYAFTEYDDSEDQDIKPSRFAFEPLGAIVPSLDEWLVHELIPKDGIGFLAGRPGAGKSFLIEDWSMRLSSGLEILGRKTLRCGVAYIAAEGAVGLRKRVKGWQLRFGVGDDVPFVMTDCAPDLRKDDDISELIAGLKSEGERFAKAGTPLGLVVIDTLSQVAPGADQNGQADMSILTRNARGIASRTGAFVLIVHHIGKDETRGLAGSFVLNAAADMVIMLTGEKHDIIKPCLIDKMKEAPDGWEFAFKLEPFDYKFAGSTFKTCVPEYLDIEPRPSRAKKPKPLTPEQSNVLTAIGYVLDHGARHSVPPVPGADTSKPAVTKDQVRERAKATGFTDAEGWGDNERQAFRRALIALATAGKIRIEGELIWVP